MDVYLLQNYSTCFGCLSHPSSGVHQTVTAASGTGHITCQSNNLPPAWPNFHILLTLISKSSYLLSFSVCLILILESSGMTTSISKQVFSFLSCSIISGRFASVVRSVITGTSHILMVPLTFMTLSSSLSVRSACQ